MTIVPNLLVTGVLALIVSLAVLVWAAMFVQRRNGGWVLVVLSVMMLLVGGGFAPLTIGVLAGVAGLGVHAPPDWWRTHLSVATRRFLARLWPWVFGVCAINGVFLVVGSVILVYLAGMNNPDLFVGSFFFAVVSLLLTIVTGFAFDTQNGGRREARPSMEAG